MPDDLLFEGQFGTGALPLPLDIRDYSLHREPSVAAILESGVPAAYDMRDKVRGVYNQGQSPACVAFSSCGMQSMFEEIETSRWPTFDAMALYRAAGGDGRSGVDSRRVLQLMQTDGLRESGGVNACKLASYAFIDFSAGQFAIDTLKAAIATNHPCVLALLLPGDFLSGEQCTGATVQPNSYHQILAIGFTPDRFIFLNSWGAQFGTNGIGSIPWSFLLRTEQRGYVYAFSAVDSPDDGGPPPPPPVDLTVTGYQGSAGMVPQFLSSGPLTIVGTGLDVGALQVLFGSSQLSVGLRSATSALVTLPPFEVPTTGRIKVQREAVAVSGPLLVVTPGNVPPPPPVGDLTVSIAVSRRQTTIGIFAVVHDPAGALASAQCSGTCGNVLLGQRSTGGSSGVPAAWQAPRHDGDVISLVATDSQGRRGTGTATV